nr:DUF3329 domain-containing protein [uncultured Williamsia sp.]
MTSSSATISAAKADTTTTDEPATVTEPSSADTETGPDDGTNENATTAAEHDPAARTVTVSRRRRLLARAVIGILLVAAVIGGVLAGIWGTSLQDREQVADAAKAAEDTARTYAVTLTSIDSATIDQNFQQVLDGATGSFKDMYAKSSDQLKTLLVQNKATSKGQVIDSGVQSASRDRVVVLLFVDQSVTNNQSPDPRVDRSRITMTMNRVDGRWLASQVDLK